MAPRVFGGLDEQMGSCSVNEFEHVPHDGRDFPTALGRLTSTDSYVDALASEFLKSEYAGDRYVNWPLDRRLEGFLQRGCADHVSDSGDLFNIILDRVMLFIGYRSSDRPADRRSVDDERATAPSQRSAGNQDGGSGTDDQFDLS